MANDILVLKVALQNAKKIWRRIAIRGNQTLDDLHESIFDAFGRFDPHMYSFFFPEKPTKSLQKLMDSPGVICPFGAENPGPLAELFGDEPPPNAAKARMDQLRLELKQKFYYLFDFGDEWWHEITVEQTDTHRNRDSGKDPRVIEKRGESPRQYPEYEE